MRQPPLAMPNPSVGMENALVHQNTHAGVGDREHGRTEEAGAEVHRPSPDKQNDPEDGR